MDDDEEEEATIPSYALELFRRRNGSTDTTAQIWKQIENEIYGLPEIQVRKIYKFIRITVLAIGNIIGLIQYDQQATLKLADQR